MILASSTSAAESRVVQSLDGSWEILFDAQNEGRAKAWHQDQAFTAQAAKRAISVPSCWEEVEKDYEGVAYYRRTFKAPANWAGRIVRLHFDAVNFMAEIWLNDKAVGFHEGGFTPFEFRVDQMIKAGEENTLTVRVAGPILMENKRIEGVGQMETTQWRGAITGGIWQSVRLVATGDTYVNDVFIEPKIADNTATFHLELENAGVKRASAQVSVVLRPVKRPEQIVAQVEKTVELQPGATRFDCVLAIPEALHWSPDHPHLYEAVVTLAAGSAGADEWRTRFGLREFTLRDGRFQLNGQPLYLKATFFEGLYPVKLAYPDSRDMAIREIRLAKEAGFNMIRPWRKPPPPMWLDLADELGVLTVGSLAIECMDFPIESARLPGWVENEVSQSILRDRNRACVVQWELFNEIKRPVLAQLLHPMAMRARELDPTRLILDESGGWAQGANLYLPYEREPTKFNDIHHYPGPQINRDTYDSLLHVARKTPEEMRAMGVLGRLPGKNVQLGLPSYISELGYGSLPDLVDNNQRFVRSGNPIVPPTAYHRRLAEGQRRALQESGFDALYPDLQRFCLDQQQQHGVANQRMIEAARCNPAVIGYCIHALTDGDWIIGAGLLDLWRNPKTHAYAATRKANQPRLVSLRLLPRNAYAERGTRLEITGINELAAVAGRLHVEVVAADGSVAYRQEVPVVMTSGITPLFGEAIATRSLAGHYTVKARVIAADGALITENTQELDVFTPRQLAAPTAPIAVLDPANLLKPFLKKTGVAFSDFDPGANPLVPVFVSATTARTPEQKQRFAELVRFVERGGTAVCLQGVGAISDHRFAGAAARTTSPLLPVTYRAVSAVGSWTGIPQLVKSHPIFEGLPTGGMMGTVYENVWSPVALCDIGGEAIVAAIGFDWFPEGDRMKRHYYGPGDSWWGAVVTNLPRGEGRLILSQLRLLDNLGKDPVADKILFNLIRFTTKSE